MLKIKVFKSAGGHRTIGNTSMGVSDYVYNIYLFGFLIHSVTIREVSGQARTSMFGGAEIYE